MINKKIELNKKNKSTILDIQLLYSTQIIKSFK